MNFTRDDVAQWRSDTAVVIADNGETVAVVGMVGARGPFVQSWHKRVGDEEVRRITRAQADAAKAEQAAIEQLELRPTDPNVPTEDRPRLTGQNAAVLERLRRGPATNVELAEIALKYSSRISDLRHAGHVIEATRRDDGTWLYELKGVNGCSDTSATAGER